MRPDFGNFMVREAQDEADVVRLTVRALARTHT